MWNERITKGDEKQEQSNVMSYVCLKLNARVGPWTRAIRFPCLTRLPLQPAPLWLAGADIAGNKGNVALVPAVGDVEVVRGGVTALHLHAPDVSMPSLLETLLSCIAFSSVNRRVSDNVRGEIYAPARHVELVLKRRMVAQRRLAVHHQPMA